MSQQARLKLHAMRLCIPLALALTATAGLAAPSVTDPAGDYLPTFLGPAGSGDLDILSATVTYNAANQTFTLSSSQAATVGGNIFRQYFWGVDTGAGTAQFAAYGLTGVYFDTTIQLVATGTGSVGDNFLPFGSVSFSGNAVSTTFSASLLPSHGYKPNKYLWSVWTRDLGTQGGPGGDFAQVADIAPGNASFTASTVPEPASLLLMLLGGAVIAARRGQHRGQPANLRG